MRRSDVFLIAAWSASVLGAFEGVVLEVARAFPSVLAPDKAPVHILWVAPLVDLALFLALAGMLAPAVRLLARLPRIRPAVAVFGMFTAIGISNVLTAPAVLHPASAAILALGMTVACCRTVAVTDARLLAWLRARVGWLPLLLAALLVAAAGYDKGRETARSRRLPAPIAKAPNVLVIVLDTVRHDRFSRPEYEGLAPGLTRLASEGLRFENAWSTSSWSLPAQTSILTGRYAHQHGADWPTLARGTSVPTLQRFLASKGYATGAFSGNSAWVTPEYLGNEFLRFDAYVPADVLSRTVFGRRVDRLLWRFGYHAAGRGKKAPELNRQLLHFIDRYRDRPFFAYACYMDVHQAFHARRLNRPFWTPAPPAGAVIEAYNNGIRSLDRHIGELVAELARRGALDRTIVVVTSDHGESFGAANPGDHDPSGHATSLYPEELRVPLFVRYPGAVGPGWTTQRLTSVREIPGFIVRLLGLQDAPFTTAPLPLRSMPQDSGDRELLATLNYDRYRAQSVVSGRWQYIRDESAGRSVEHLFDLGADPQAHNDLGPSHHAVGPMRLALRRLLAQ
ncbi:MAG: sulfatase [Acidobacteria bacterium]|nr:sulfatase [Acidobacteriota bacterium]